MARWQPDARGRLQEAALTLYGERGFDNTTVTEIAERLPSLATRRTFFRYFADKREVLFSGAKELEDLFTTEVSVAPESVSPLDAVATGLEAVAAMFEPLREYAARRQRVITSPGAAGARIDQIGIVGRSSGRGAPWPRGRGSNRDPHR